MKKLTKKQMIIGVSVAILLIGGGATLGVVTHNNSVHAQQVAKAKVKAADKAKAEQLAKEKEIAQQKQVATLLASATANPSDESIKALNDAIAKLTDQKEKTKDADLVKGLNSRLALIKKAQAAVKDYQAHATDAGKQKAAQAAINALTDKNDENVKAQLQKLFDASNKQAQEAAKSAQVKQSALKAAEQTQNNTSQSEVSQTTNQQNENTYQSPVTETQTPNYGGGSTSSNTGGTISDTSGAATGYASSNTPSGNTSSGSSTSGGTTPSHPGGYGSIEDANKAEQDAGNASTHFPGGW